MPLHATADQNNLFKSWQAPRLCGEAGRLEWKSISCVLYKTCTWGWPIYWYIIKISTWLHCNIQKAWWQSTVKLQVLNYKSSQAIKMMTNVTSWFSCFLVKLKIVMQKGSFQLIVNHIKDIITSKILAIDCPYHAALVVTLQYMNATIYSRRLNILWMILFHEQKVSSKLVLCFWCHDIKLWHKT